MEATNAKRELVIAGSYFLLAILGVLLIFYARADPRLARLMVHVIPGANAYVGEAESGKLYEGQVTVKAGSDFIYDFTVAPGMYDYCIRGYFAVLDGDTTDFTGVITDKNNFRKWIAGKEAKRDYSWDQSGNSKAIDLSLDTPGRYVLALRSERSDTSETRVLIMLQAFWNHTPRLYSIVPVR